jgi:hypothetical protein
MQERFVTRHYYMGILKATGDFKIAPAVPLLNIVT